MSNNLDTSDLSGGMANPETAVNDAIHKHDAALTETLVFDLTVDETMSAADYRSAVRISVTPIGTSKTLTLPAVKKLTYIQNDDADDFDLAKGATTIALAAGDG